MTSSQHPRPERVLYVLKRYPRLSETFIVRELLGLEAAGVTIGVEALLAAEPGTHHLEVSAVEATVRYLPRHPRPSVGLVAAHGRLLVRRPAVWWALASTARRRGGRAWRRFLQAGLVADRARREHYHHIHAHFATAAAEVARDASALSGVPFTVTAHAKDIFHEDNAPLVAERVAGAAAVVTVSRYNVEHLGRSLPGTPVAFVPNGMSIPSASAPTPNGPVLCVARLVPKKGIDLLIEAVARTARPVRLEIVGDGPCRAELEALAERLGISHRVTFLGARTSDEVDAAYRRCSMMVLPCRVAPDGDRDGMPTVLVEAMGRALPVVSCDIVGIGELIEHGVTGLLAAPEDPQAIAEAIDRLTADGEEAAVLGIAARLRVIQEFEPERTAAALMTVFAGEHIGAEHGALV